MFLISPISSTRKLLQKTVENFKSLISGGYKRLPKSPQKKKKKKERSPREMGYECDVEGEKEEANERSRRKLQAATSKHKRRSVDQDSEAGRRMHTEKLMKELEMMYKSNPEHVLDVEEVRHCYSRLTCSPYRDIVDKFFMDIYSHLSTSSSSSSSTTRQLLISCNPNRPLPCMSNHLHCCLFSM